MDKLDIPKAYEAKDYEDAIYAAWEASGFFNPDNLPGDRPLAFSITLPPPNVTGTLHMGHAVMLAIEDIMVRYQRMCGKRVLWIPGTDHAAIATQAKVEKLLMKEEGKSRHDLGREAFLKRVEQFAAKSHDIIVNQAKKMGASLDWSREAYTLDAPRSLAVRTAFKRMYDDGLIYRGNRVINWCSRCQSTLADDEVDYKETNAKFYYLKYGPITIGTARPETKFLDKVIVVHPDDARYADIVGKEFDVEWIEGTVRARVIADKASDMTFGTGAMTITPAHSHEDFQIAKEHGLEVVQIISEDGTFTSAAGAFAGKNARASRDEIVAVLEKKGLVERIDENYVHNLSVCYRCETPVEPLPKLQWFIDVNKEFNRDGKQVTLKALMQDAVRSGAIKIVPERFDKTYFNWVDNLRDWCISRQLWFGHRIPAWYRSSVIASEARQSYGEIATSSSTPRNDSELYVGIEAPEGEGWVQDPDTFDTWFSAGLWTISTLGWPDQGSQTLQQLRTYHPTSVLETGYDILFFWVARMVLMTTYLVGEVPFKMVYLHGLVRDEQGRKMSKSLDNVIDPLDMIAKFGADATRLSLVIGSTPGNDSKLSEEKVAGYRNFTNKLWNISRFVLTTTNNHPQPILEKEGRSTLYSPPFEGGAKGWLPETLADRWILSRLDTVVASVTKKLSAHELSSAGEELRDFTWNDFADWYLEIAKIQKREQTDQILLHVLETILKLWHPFMPFVTEQIWKNFSGNMLLIQSWPTVTGSADLEAEKEFSFIQEIIGAIRNLRAANKIEPIKKVSIVVDRDIPEHEIIKQLARVTDITVGEKPDGSVSTVVGSLTIHIPLTGLVDLEAERTRLTKERDELISYIASIDTKLSNTEFTGKAPEKVVAQMKEKREDAARKLFAVNGQIFMIKSQ